MMPLPAMCKDPKIKTGKIMSVRRKTKPGRNIHGILLLDKPIGITSNAALQQVKKLFNARKAGHTGSLDPIASGMLPLCFGEATKFSQFLLEADKHYRVIAKLGVKTTTGDIEGEIIHQQTVSGISQDILLNTLAKFKGEIEQIPSMFSAIKHQGQPLYKLARQGIEVERKPRVITIYELNLLHYQDNDSFEFDVRCSKGTYVRNLVEDIGEILGCGAHVTSLRRLAAGPYQAEQMISMDALTALFTENGVAAADAHLLPVDSSVASWPTITISETAAFYLRQGQAIIVPHAPTSGWVRVMLKDGRFLGVAEILDDGKVAPRRLVK
jgi:tRNA pseudouridine55 synthase